MSHVCGKTVACYNFRYKVQRLIPSNFAARVLLPPALARASSMVSGCRVVSEDWIISEVTVGTCRESCSTASGRSLTDMMFDVQRIMARSITCSSSWITQSNEATEKSGSYIRNKIIQKGVSKKSFYNKILLCFYSVAPLLPVSNAFSRFIYSE